VLTTGTFLIESGREITNTVYENSQAIPGVDITASPITKITLLPVDSSTIQTRSKQVYYNLKFTPTNEIPQGGTIEIVFNNNFNLDSQIIPSHIVSGLDDIAVDSTV
jgi:hypothetical protein